VSVEYLVNGDSGVDDDERNKAGMAWLSLWTLADGFAKTEIQLIIFRAMVRALGFVTFRWA
jgi:hypothetical protein